jgi:hypothetical protein
MLDMLGMRRKPAPSPLDGKLLLIGLGAQKAGSSWLAQYLKAHPEVFVSGLKELHYFDSVYEPSTSRRSGHAEHRLERLAGKIAAKAEARGIPLSPEGLEKIAAVRDRLKMTSGSRYRYLQFFEDRVTTESVFCDITPAYAMLDARGFEAILRTHGNVAFVFILRDPVDRFWSAARMAMQNRKDFDPYARFSELLDKEGVYRRTDYRRTMLELEKVVPAERIKYLFYETLFTQGSVDALSSFIGVQPWPADFDKVVNPGKRAPIKPEHALAAFNKFRHVYEFVFDRFGESTPARWRSAAAGVLPPG